MADSRAGFDPRGLVIPTIVDRLAETSPDAIFAEYPKAVLTYDDGYYSVTYRQLANAINGVAKWIVDSIGSGDGYEKLAYFGPADMRYPVLHCGAIKAGYCMYFPSPRNSIPAHRNLLEKLDCTKLVSPFPRPPPVDAILAAREMQVLDAPSVEELLEKEYPPFPYTKTAAEAAPYPHYALHTSGSTGFPKPIVPSHGHISKNITIATSNPPAGHKSQDQSVQGKRMFLPFPSFHAGGIGTQLLWGIAMGAIMVLPTSGSLPSITGMVEALKKTTIDIAFIPPSLIADLGQSPELLDFCAERLESIMYVGGDLPKVLGDRVASRIPIFNQYGATELGMMPLLQADDRDPLDWKYIQLHPGIGPEFRPYRDEEHQLFLVRNETTEPNISVFNLFPDQTEYDTRDLFVRHPQKKDLWEWSGRVDDIIVFLNGEKTNPISMEHTIVSRNSHVTGALVAGNQRFQASLLIEISSLNSAKDEKAPSPSERAALIDKIWPSIEEANQECPAHAQITKSHVLFTTPDKPMIRAGKGTIQRAGTLALYKDELDALYRDADRVTVQVGGPVAVSGYDINVISQYIEEFFAKGPALERTDNLFLKGIDSLQVITLVRSLRQYLQSPIIDVPLVYSYPSVDELSKAIVERLQNEQNVKKTQQNASREEARSILSEYQGLIDGSSSEDTVILTGSTGVIGSYVLDELLANQSIKHVYCLNRQEKSQSIKKHSELHASRGLPPLDFERSTRISFLTVNLAEEFFGLPEETYNQLRKSVTLIIHNAWPVNFNLSLSSFKPQLAGVVRLIDFCSTSALSAHLFFVSSFSSVASFQNDSKVTPEEVITGYEHSTNGYAESKYLAERLLDYAVQKRPNFHASIARVGQVAGAVRNQDVWNKSEWFPSLVISSLRIGALPESLGPGLDDIDWVPADLLADVLVELALGCRNPKGVQVFHPLNLHPTSWKAIIPTVLDELFKLSGTKLETVPLSEWVDKVHEHMEQIAGSHQVLAEGELETFVDKIPAVRLLDFYHMILENSQKTEDLNVFSTTKAANASLRLQAVDGVKDVWIRKWIREWIPQQNSIQIN